MHLFVDLTKLSKSPLHHGALAKLNRHFILNSLSKAVISGASNRVRSWPETVLKDLKLSDTIRCGTPRLLMNLCKLRKKACGLRLGVTSRCTALAVAQVYNATYTFDIGDLMPADIFTYRVRGRQRQRFQMEFLPQDESEACAVSGVA